jgi:two-component system cell cycle response regulator DivK
VGRVQLRDLGEGLDGRVIAHHEIEHAGQEVRIGGGTAQGLRPNSCLSQEQAQPLGIAANEIQRLNRNDLSHFPRVLGTSNGFEALNLVRKMRPDLILMDIQLPQVSGLEVTRWIKDDPELRAIPVVAVTAFAMKGDEERIREGGCEAYLSKPISVGKFIETVRRFIG